MPGGASREPTPAAWSMDRGSDSRGQRPGPVSKKSSVHAALLVRDALSRDRVSAFRRFGASVAGTVARFLTVP
jgi:hypothetical protein